MTTRSPYTRIPALGAVLAVLVLAAGLVAGLASPVAQAAPKPKDKARTSWSVTPTGANGGAARSSFVYTLRPGAVLRDQVEIRNTGKRPVMLDLYGADAYQTSPDGAFALRNADEPRTGVGAWVRFGKTTRHKLRPGKGLMVPFELRIPRNAEPGDHAGAVVAASVKAERSGGNGSLGFNVRRRIGARIYVRVEGPLDPGMEVTGLEATGKPAVVHFVTGKGKAGMSYEVTNTGNVRTTPEARVQLVGPFGTVVHQVPVELPELLPGSKVSGELDFSSLPPLGLLRTELVVTSPEASARDSATVWSVPWVPILAVLLLALAWWVRRRRRAGLPLLPRRGSGADDAVEDPEASDPVAVG